MELHQTKLAAEQTELRLKQVETESKQKLDQLQELKCKVGSLITRFGVKTFLAKDVINMRTMKERKNSDRFGRINFTSNALRTVVDNR